MAETPTVTVTLTRKQQLQVLVATGLMVSALELPLEDLTDGDEVLARVPVPDRLKDRATSTDREEVKENG